MIKWLIGILTGIILSGAGWNEARQTSELDDHSKAISETRTDIAVIKEAARQVIENEKSNNDKLDKIIRKQDAILERQNK